MIDRLLAEIVKAQDRLQNIEFNFNDEHFIFYYSYLTLLEKVRIDTMSTTAVTTIDSNGNTTIKHEKQDHQVPIYTILEKAKDEDGKQIFNINNQEHYKIVSKLPANLASYAAYQMSLDVFNSMGKGKE